MYFEIGLLLIELSGKFSELANGCVFGDTLSKELVGVDVGHFEEVLRVAVFQPVLEKGNFNTKQHVSLYSEIYSCDCLVHTVVIVRHY